jgi:hypothetical protein
LFSKQLCFPSLLEEGLNNHNFININNFVKLLINIFFKKNLKSRFSTLNFALFRLQYTGQYVLTFHPSFFLPSSFLGIGGGGGPTSIIPCMHMTQPHWKTSREERERGQNKENPKQKCHKKEHHCNFLCRYLTSPSCVASPLQFPMHPHTTNKMYLNKVRERE